MKQRQAIKGCSHNMKRVFIYPEQEVVPKTEKKSFLHGQSVILRCPEGCADLFIEIV